MEHKKIEDARQGLRIHAETLEHQLKRAEARAVRARMSEPQFQDITDLTAFTRNWLYLFFMTMPLVLLFAIPVALVLHWSPTAFGAFFVLGVLNMRGLATLLPCSATPSSGSCRRWLVRSSCW